MEMYKHQQLGHSQATLSVSREILPKSFISRTRASRQQLGRSRLASVCKAAQVRVDGVCVLRCMMDLNGSQSLSCL